ncbi:MAG: PP2C family protein-serine/threonine phosphatase [Acidobacteriota bacterium]
MGRRRKTARKPGLEAFLRDYTAGFNVQELRRLLDRDAARAYAVLTRGRQPAAQPRTRLKRFLLRVKLVFLGISYQLPPARRLIFGLSILFAILGVLNVDFNVSREGTHISVQSQPLFFVLSLLGMGFLLVMELVDRILGRDALQVARQLQRDLLPKEAPQVPGYAFAHSYRTANDVGGDYYSFLPLADGRLALAAGDGSGHGIAAGLLMAIANAVLQTMIEIDPTPVRVAETLHRVLRKTGDHRAFLSLFYAVLEPATGRLQYVCAGHPFPLLRHADGNVEELGKGGFPLGLRNRLELHPGEATIAPGDLILLYTDGLPEAVDPAGTHAFGFDRLRTLLSGGGTAQEVHDRILKAFELHVGEETLHDDMTIVVMTRPQ